VVRRSRRHLLTVNLNSSSKLTSVAMSGRAAHATTTNTVCRRRQSVSRFSDVISLVPDPDFKVTSFLKSNIGKRRVLKTKLLLHTNRKLYLTYGMVLFIGGPRRQAKSRGGFLGAAAPSPPAKGSEGALWSPQRSLRQSLHRLKAKGFPLFSAFRMASPDTIILLIVDYHASIGVARPCGSLAYATCTQVYITSTHGHCCRQVSK